MAKQLGLGDPLPRPQHERVELDHWTHTEFWHHVLYEFDWFASRVQSRLLYYNRSTSRKGLIQ
jgi:hypothetical protein